jgi:hypothetical protein
MELSPDNMAEAHMTRPAQTRTDRTHQSAVALGQSIHAAVTRGLVVGRRVKIGLVRGIVIGYNIARRGRFPGLRYPLLVKTELGTAKFGLDEVIPA